MNTLYSVVQEQRTEEGLRFEKLQRNLRAMRRSRSPKVREAIQRANEELIQTRTTPGQVHNDSTMDLMSVEYANDEFIGTRIMPVVTVGKPSDKYFVFDKRNGLAYPDDSVGSRSQANETTRTQTTATYSTEGYALKEFVGEDTIAAQDAPLDELMDAQLNVRNGLAFNEEIRIAAIAGVSGSYGSNTAAIASGVRWDVAGSDPAENILTAILAQWSGRGQTKNVAFMSADVWKVLRLHPQLLEMRKYVSKGFLPREEFAEMFEFDEVLVGKARKDTANIGQTASYSRIWPDVFGVVRVAETPSRRSAHFGSTFRNGGVFASQTYDADAGVRGGWNVRNSIEEDHKIVAADTGYLLTTVIG